MTALSKTKVGVNIACRLIIGVLFCVSGFDKAAHPLGFMYTLSSYAIVPPVLIHVLVPLLAGVEVLLAVLVLSGLIFRITTIATAVLLAIYTAALMYSLFTGNTNHACGCFQATGSNSNGLLHLITGGNTISVSDVIRDLILIAITALMYFCHESRLGLDGIWLRYKEQDVAQAVRRKHPRSRRKQQSKAAKKHSRTQSEWISPTSVAWLSKRFNFFVGVFAIVVISVVFGLTASVKLVSAQSRSLASIAAYHPNQHALSVNTNAPNFKLSSIYGQTYNLANERGKVVLLEFFAVWCPYCQGEAPVLDKINQQFSSSDFGMISIVANPYSRDFEVSQYSDLKPYDAQDILWFKSTFHVTTPVLIDPKFKVTNQYGATGYPLIYVIDKKGVIRDVFKGPTSEAALAKSIRTLL